MQINWNNISAPSVGSRSIPLTSPFTNLGEILQKGAARNLLERKQEFEEQQIELKKQQEVDKRRKALERDQFAYNTAEKILTDRKRLDDILSKNKAYQSIENKDLKKAIANDFYNKFKGQNVRRYGNAYREFIDALISNGNYTKEEAVKYADIHLNSAFPVSTQKAREEQAKLINMLVDGGGSHRKSLTGADANKGYKELTTSKNLNNKVLPWLHNYANPVLDSGQYREAYDYLQGFSPAAREYAISKFVDTDGKPLIDFDSAEGKAQLKAAAEYLQYNNSSSDRRGGSKQYYLSPEKRYELLSKNILSGYRSGVPEEQLLKALNGIVSRKLEALSQGPQLPESLKGVKRSYPNGTFTSPLIEAPRATSEEIPDSTFSFTGFMDSLGNLVDTLSNNKESIGDFLNTPIFGDQSNTSKSGTPKLSEALMVAESGGSKNPYIRTTVSDTVGGSTAYGPMQLTATTAEDFVNRYPQFFSPKEKAYAKRFIEQGKKFAKYGNNPQLEGYDSKYDYGGEGDLTSKEDREMYTKFANRILNLMTKDLTKKLGRKPSNLEIAQAWRGVSPEDDPKYFDTLKQILRQ